MDYITDIESRHKCAHEQCQCQIPSTQEYCSDFCSDADDIEEVELQCDCKHSPCALDWGRPGPGDWRARYRCYEFKSGGDTP